MSLVKKEGNRKRLKTNQDIKAEIIAQHELNEGVNPCGCTLDVRITDKAIITERDWCPKHWKIEKAKQ